MKIKFLLLFLFAATSVFSQSVLKGKVFNSDNEPLPGASVVISGSVIGTVTNEKGEFVLPNLKSDTYPLKISFVGYRPYLTKIAVVKDMVLNVTLQKDEVMTDEVFVYATRAGSKSPFVTDEISKEAIASKNMGQDIPYLLNMSPSFVATSDAGTGIGYTGFRIRGTDANRINVTINGIPLNDAESHAVYWVNMPDFSSSIENVQVQRGVGSSTFGAGAFGATVNMQTNSLRYEPYAQYNGAAGSFNSFKNSFEVGTGLINNHFSFDARLSAISSDGFIDRASSNLKSYYLSGGYYSDQTLIKFITFAGNEKTYQAWNGVPSVRLKSDMDGMLVYAEHGLYTTMETEEMIASNPRTYNLYTYDNETDNYTQNHYQLLLNQKFGDFFHLNAALHYTHGEGYYEQFKRNKKFSDYGMDNFTTKNDTIKRTDLIRQKWLDNDFYGGTLALNYLKDRVDFTFGAGWNRYDGLHFGKIIWAQYMGNYSKDFEWYRGTGVKTDFNVYVKVNYAVTEKLSLYADLQYRNVLHTIDGTDDDLRDLIQDHIYDFFNPKAGVHYQVSENSKLFASWAVGHREPNRSNFTDADPGAKVPTFEKLDDFEAGYSFASNKISLAANLFYMHYKDQLILTGQINDVGSPVMVNVDRSYRAGLEFIAGVKLFSTLRWDLNTTLSQNKILDFTEHVDNWDTWGQEEIFIGTTDIAFSPSVVANSVISFNPVEPLVISLMTQYVGKQYIDNSSSNDRIIDPYLVNSIKVAYTLKPAWFNELQVNLLINNLFNEEYETNAWVYSYIYNGQRYKMDGYFPQAGINFMVGVSLKF